MTHETCSDLLNAYIDGELDVDLRLDVEVHLRVCSECRVSARELTAVRDGLSNPPYGPSDGPPPWAEIQRALGRRDSPTSARRALVRRVVVAAGVAAAVALIASTGNRVERRIDPATRSTEWRGADAATNDLAARELEQFIHANRAQLVPAMFSAADETIAVLDGAIKDVQLSLAQDPEDPFLSLYLALLERKRMAALRSVATTVRRTS